MIDEEIITSEPENTIPDPDPAPEPAPAPEPDPEPIPEPEPAPDPEPTPDPAAPVEVVTVEDLLDRLTGDSQGDGETEEPPQAVFLPAAPFFEPLSAPLPSAATPKRTG